MSLKNLVVAITVVFGLLVLVLILLIIFGPGLTPGGPIIVIRPITEELNAAQTTSCTPQCTGKGPCWYIGCQDSSHCDNLPDLAIDNEKMSSPPWRFVHWAGVESITYTLKSIGKPQDASKAELTIGKTVLTIDVPNPNDVPVWTFDGKTLKGNIIYYMPNWPHDLLGEITEVTVTDRQTKEPVKIALEDLMEIRISYNQSALYPDCKD